MENGLTLEPKNGNISNLEKPNKSNACIVAEKLTKLSPEDPRIVDYLIDESKKIADKYKLPDISQMFSAPREYDEQLGNVRMVNKIGWLTKSETGHFFEEYPDTSAAYFCDTNSIAINTEKQKDPNYNLGLYYMQITHEIIHGLQHIKDPDMEIEQKEYEAHVVSTPLKFLKENGFLKGDSAKNLVEEIFDGISYSVDLYNKQILKKNITMRTVK